MDQSKTDVPNPTRIFKSIANLQKLRTHLVGVIAHSGLCPMGKNFFGSFDLFQWKHDSNLTMNILASILEIFNDRFGLPPVLNLQLDNCWRENKNRHVFTLLSLLVEWSVFEKVKWRIVCFIYICTNHMQMPKMFSFFFMSLLYINAPDSDILCSCCQNKMHTCFSSPNT